MFKTIATVLFSLSFLAQVDRVYFYSRYSEALSRMMREIGRSFGL